ncbi:DUF6053 domain-containing protein [Lysobacter enzymogenes]|uniref:DUF6053 domain-containing protein n=1 Tax=Lysobacter enzymogenes TaxID=69 RepID=UPI003D18F97F
MGGPSGPTFSGRVAMSRSNGIGPQGPPTTTKEIHRPCRSTRRAFVVLMKARCAPPPRPRLSSLHPKETPPCNSPPTCPSTATAARRSRPTRRSSAARSTR